MASRTQVDSATAPASSKMARQLVAALIFSSATLAFVSHARAQTSLTGSSLAYKSLGGSSTSLTQTGYLGTYLVVPTGGATVNFDANATGTCGSHECCRGQLAIWFQRHRWCCG